MRIHNITYSNISWDPKTGVLFGIVTFHTLNGPIHVECALNDYVPSPDNPPRKALRKLAKPKLPCPAMSQMQSTFAALMSRAA